ncbi:MAG: [protein-PII] uridylyltransferase [Candidatus Nanopelagicales bacterium]
MAAGPVPARRGEGRSAALVAIGGYGRGELAIGSDLDVLLLHEGTVGDLPDRIWYPVWDSRLRLDHSVRTLSEARRLAARDLKVVLGLLDARPVAGDELLVERLASSIRSDWRGFAPRRMDELRASVDERRERQGEVAHLLEPDLKESFGGLRDLTVLRAIAAAWLTDIPHSDLEPAAALLMDTRDALHQRTGKSADRLLMQEQDGVAATLGYGDSERLMRDVSATGRLVGHASDTTWYRVSRVTRRSSRRPFRKLGGRRARAPLADGVVVQEDEVVLAADARPERDPVLVLRAAAAAAQSGLHLAPHAVQRLAEESAPMPVPWPAGARDAFVSLLGAGRATLPVWESLDQAGVWLRLIPGWEVVRSAPQRNPVHRFTVDRHLVETAIQAAKYQRDVDRPDLLVVGALLHDIGKGRPGTDHTEVGVELVADLAPRLGFDDHDSATLVSLVRHHLLLPETATRRDLEDPATIQRVVEAVGDRSTLELLYALTKADAQATGPAAWSDWRAALIGELVDRVRGALSGGYEITGIPLSAEQQDLLDSGATDVLVAAGAPGDMLSVTVTAPDRLGLLATVAGVLAANRLDVRAARAGGADGMALSEWTVDPGFSGMPAPERLREDLRRALDGTLDLAARLDKREASYRDRTEMMALEPRVDVVPEASATATVVEVRTYDRPGALFRLATALAESGLDIAGARADSLGSNVVDVFYVRTADGEPLDPDETAAVVKRLVDVAGA